MRVLNQMRSQIYGNFIMQVMDIKRTLREIEEMFEIIVKAEQTEQNYDIIVAI